MAERDKADITTTIHIITNVSAPTPNKIPTTVPVMLNELDDPEPGFVAVCVCVCVCV